MQHCSARSTACCMAGMINLPPAGDQLTSQARGLLSMSCCSSPTAAASSAGNATLSIASIAGSNVGYTVSFRYSEAVIGSGWRGVLAKPPTSPTIFARWNRLHPVSWDAKLMSPFSSKLRGVVGGKDGACDGIQRGECRIILIRPGKLHDPAHGQPSHSC
jgi:hypothetical protein